jgi:hypothetical protein
MCPNQKTEKQKKKIFRDKPKMTTEGVSDKMRGDNTMAVGEQFVWIDGEGGKSRFAAGSGFKKKTSVLGAEDGQKSGLDFLSSQISLLASLHHWVDDLARTMFPVAEPTPTITAEKVAPIKTHGTLLDTTVCSVFFRCLTRLHSQLRSLCLRAARRAP